jgi:hypothetical protein
MNTLQDRLDDFITNKPSFITNCDKHGDSVTAYANSKCIACEEDAKRIKIERDILKYKQELINLANIPKRYLNKDFTNYEELSEEHKIFKYQIEHNNSRAPRRLKMIAAPRLIMYKLPNSSEVSSS